ncbi:MAG TPA: TonB-dependent receptor, partial [Saprospiraceae bacterium]|nr:TonB-dependent receptor [Saprospiraceae bacterium]
MKKLTLLTSLIFVLSTNFLLAQDKHITGKVSSSVDGSPLIGVTIKVKTSSVGTVSDIDGNYSLDVPKGAILVFSSIGYNDGSVEVGDQNQFDMVMIQVTTTLNQVVVVGTRSPGRALLDTPVPVDVVNVNQVTMPTARMDLTSILNYSAPSFNYNKQSGSDGADHIDLATLRGLGPDQVLVLINGKRRHQTAFVSVFGTRGRGNSGTDLNALPAAAIDRVEILRDGASAQYGSDAIAGVINLVLKKSTNELSVNAGYSAYYDKEFNPYFNNKLKSQYIYEGGLDGKTVSIDANYGIPLKRDGFINFTLNYVNAGKTYRQVLDTANLFTSKTSLPLNTVRRANGDGSLDMFGAFVNSEVPLNNDGTTLYFFGGYNRKNSDAYAFSRNFSLKPERFPTDAGGNLIDVPGIIVHTADDQYFNPHIQTEITDISLAAGVKGKMNNGWDWDFSNTIGNNDFHFFGDKTFNASLGQPNRNHFDDGGFSFLQNTANINFTKEISAVLSGLNLALGAEYRLEEYKIFAGEEASYKNYDTTGIKATGSQGFPGYQPADVVDANRSNVGFYVDAELDVSKSWLLGGAVRIENYSDFGLAPNFKLATRYKLNDKINLRGSVSTGFRAPSLQQINFSSTFTTVQGGEISEVKIAPNDNAITRAAGIPELKQETSLNGSLGFTAKINKAINLSVDAYWVQVKDRVV